MLNGNRRAFSGTALCQNTMGLRFCHNGRGGHKIRAARAARAETVGEIRETRDEVVSDDDVTGPRDA